MRMGEREIGIEEVRKILEKGRRIEEYAYDTPYPSELLLYWEGGRPLHLVVATNEVDGVKFVITVYEPDPLRWEENFQKRKVDQSSPPA